MLWVTRSNHKAVNHPLNGGEVPNRALWRRNAFRVQLSCNRPQRLPGIELCREHTSQGRSAFLGAFPVFRGRGRTLRLCLPSSTPFALARARASRVRWEIMANVCNSYALPPLARNSIFQSKPPNWKVTGSRRGAHNHRGGSRFSSGAFFDF